MYTSAHWQHVCFHMRSYSMLTGTQCVAERWERISGWMDGFSGDRTLLLIPVLPRQSPLISVAWSALPPSLFTNTTAQTPVCSHLIFYLCLLHLSYWDFSLRCNFFLTCFFPDYTACVSLIFLDYYNSLYLSQIINSISSFLCFLLCITIVHFRSICLNIPYASKFWVLIAINC